MSDPVRIEGLAELLKKLKAIGELDQIKPALKAAALHIKGVVNEYPPATEANSPSQARWYERGYGPRWRLADGSVGGRKTSKTLGRKWTVKSSQGGYTWTVGNNVSYGPFVQDPDHQAAFHRERGWLTTQDVADQETDTVLEFLKMAVDSILEDS